MCDDRQLCYNKRLCVIIEGYVTIKIMCDARRLCDNKRYCVMIEDYVTIKDYA